MKARKGSTHGYDIVDHTKLNPELGGEAGFERLSARAEAARPRPDPRFRAQPCRRAFRRQSLVARRAGMGPGLAARGLVRHRLGAVCPIAPAAACCCRSSARPTGRRWRAARSSCATTPSEGSFSAWYFEHRLPIAPERYGEILRTIVKEAGAEDSAAGKRHSRARLAPQGIAPSQPQGSARLQGGTEADRRRRRDHRARAGRLSRGDRTGRRRRWRCIICWSASTTGSAHWRLASSDINYRRFFDINTLAGLRVEDAGTFEAIHRLVRTTDRGRAGCRACGSITSTACAIPRNISSACAA